MFDYRCLLCSTRLSPPASQRAKGFTSQWTLLVLPLLLSMTLFATAPFTLSILLLIPTVLLLWVYPRRDISSPLPSSKGSPSREEVPFMIALTVYRTHMMLMTVLAILAVDFPMDLGVGSFVFSQGLVSAIPLISQPYHLLEPTSRKLLKTIRKSIPIIVLGGIRVLLVKGTDYPEHVTEYGVHWNFFITLALLPIFQALHPLLSRYLISLICLTLAFRTSLPSLPSSHFTNPSTPHNTMQQTLPSSYLSSILTTSTPRTTLLTQNNESVSSLLGYLSIHILGLSLGTVVLPCSPGWFRRHQVAVDVFRRMGNRPAYFDFDVSASGGGVNLEWV
ncbi:GPI-anchored wall transfer protein 1 [Leucoagaricus sp. SymC.cos]|nr:GPI-anchored wall transfer protein 1 [Leucoagaricus sp. SymC.cos]